jgi:hypothetical protein
MSKVLELYRAFKHEHTLYIYIYINLCLNNFLTENLHFLL